MTLLEFCGLFCSFCLHHKNELIFRPIKHSYRFIIGFNILRLLWPFSMFMIQKYEIRLKIKNQSLCKMSLSHFPPFPWSDKEQFKPFWRSLLGQTKRRTWKLTNLCQIRMISHLRVRTSIKIEFFLTEKTIFDFFAWFIF